MASPTTNSVPTTEVTNLDGQILNIRALVDDFGIKWGAGAQGTGVTLTYSFIKTGSGSTFYAEYSDPDGAGAEPGTDEQLQNVALTSLEQAAVTSALTGWSNVANITFTLVNETSTTVGEFRAGKSVVVEEEGAAGWAYLPGDFPEAGDLWLANGPSFNDPDSPFPEDGGTSVPKGTYDYSTILHELGHALGLQHPHNDGFGDEFLVDDPDAAGTPESLELMLKSVMSYQYGFGFMPGFEPTTPMVLDIAAMQYLYGANTNFNKTNTTYSFSATGQYNQTIWDAGGIDTIVYTGNTGGLIDLNAGQASHLGVPVEYFNLDTEVQYTDPRTVWIALGAKIENATGGKGGDTINGNSLSNVLNGMGGHDLLSGANGNDTLLGGTGNDELRGSNGNDILRGEDGNDTQFGDAGNDDVRGGLGNDTLRGGDGNDVMLGEDGNDDVRGAAGNDNLTGAAGNDSLRGEDGNDTVFGDAGIDTLRGGLGNDVLRGGDGDDVLLGEEGVDDVRGGAGSDTLNGASGGDVLRGEDGNDTLIGGTGSDNLGGGAGTDIFVFDVLPPAGVFDKITDFTPLDDTIHLSLTAFPALGMTGELDVDSFVAHSSGLAQDPEDRIVYDTDTGQLYYDRDGSNATNAPVQIAVLTGVLPTLTFDDFVVIT